MKLVFQNHYLDSNAVLFDFRFTQDSYPVSEDIIGNNITICIELVIDGTLPRDTELNVITEDGSATG